VSNGKLSARGRGFACPEPAVTASSYSLTASCAAAVAPIDRRCTALPWRRRKRSGMIDQIYGSARSVNAAWCIPAAPAYRLALIKIVEVNS